MLVITGIFVGTAAGLLLMALLRAGAEKAAE